MYMQQNFPALYTHSLSTEPLILFGITFRDVSPAHQHSYHRCLNREQGRRRASQLRSVVFIVHHSMACEMPVHPCQKRVRVLFLWRRSFAGLPLLFHRLLFLFCGLPSNALLTGIRMYRRHWIFVSEYMYRVLQPTDAAQQINIEDMKDVRIQVG